MSTVSSILPVERIESRIFLLRGQKVIVDSHLAELYEVTTKALNQAVQRNRERFPADFMFQLSEDETESLSKSQFVPSKPESDHIAIDNRDLLRSQIVTSKRPPHTGGRRYRPYAFTEQGVAMLSGLLNSPRAIAVNVEIMRAFVRMRQLLSTHVDLARKLSSLEKKYDAQFKAVFDAIRELMTPPSEPEREMGFHTLLKKSRKAKIKV